MLCSEWRLVHKGSVFFGPHLWLAAHVEKNPEPVTFTPPTLVTTHPTGLPPPPSPSHLSPPPATLSKPLTNEELLKSIGFLPSDSTQDEGAAAPLINTEPGSNDDSATSSTSKLIETFEMIDSPSPSPVQAEDRIEASDSGDFVIILPDCFNLEKPVSGFLPLRSLSSESSKTDVVLTPEELSRSSESQHTTLALEDSVLSIDGACRGNGFIDDDITSLTGSVSPSSPRRNTTLTSDRLTLRKLRGGLCCNPLIVASGLVNAVTDFMDEKVHFAPAKQDDAEMEGALSDSSSDEEFKVSIYI